MGLDEEFVKICLKKMKASASRVESLNSYNIDPNYRDVVKKDIAVEIQKQIEEYVKTFDLLDKYISDKKYYDEPIPSVKSIEKTMWRKASQDNKKLNKNDLIKKVNQEEKISDYDEIIQSIEKKEDETSKINIEFDSIEELISDLEEKENSTQQKINIEYDTIDYIINDLEKDSTSTGIKVEKEHKESILRDDEIVNANNEIEYLLNFYKKSINYINIEEENRNKAEDSIENFVNTYLILKNRRDLIKERYTPSNKEIDDFVNIYQILKNYKENVDNILIENQQIKTTEISEEKKIESISNDNKIVCPKCRNFVSDKEVCEICGFKLRLEKVIYDESLEEEDLKKINLNVVSEEAVKVQNEISYSDLDSEILDQVKQNNNQSLITEKQKSEYSQIEQLALNIFSTYMDNFMLMSGIISSTSGLYLIFSQLLSNGSNLNAAMNIIISITDLLPGVFIPLYNLTLYNLTLYNPYIIGMTLSIIGLNLILIIIGLRKGYLFFKTIGIVTLLIAIYFDVIRIMSTEYLIASWFIIGIIPNIIVLYYFFNRDSYYRNGYDANQ